MLLRPLEVAKKRHTIVPFVLERIAQSVALSKDGPILIEMLDGVIESKF